MPRKFACYDIALIGFLSFLLFSFTGRKPKNQLLVLFLVHIITCPGTVAPQAPPAGQLLSVCPAGTGWEVSALPSYSQSCALPHPGLQAEPCISSVPFTLCYRSCQLCSQNLFLAASALKSFSLMVFLLFCLTCFCSSQQGLFVILMSSLCHYSSFASHERFSTWVERFRDIFCNSVLAFHCGPECVSSFVLIVTNPGALLLCNTEILHKSPCL